MKFSIARQVFSCLYRKKKKKCASCGKLVVETLQKCANCDCFMSGVILRKTPIPLSINCPFKISYSGVDKVRHRKCHPKWKPNLCYDASIFKLILMLTVSILSIKFAQFHCCLRLLLHIASKDNGHQCKAHMIAQHAKC